jgi:hypothetical protein
MIPTWLTLITVIGCFVIGYMIGTIERRMPAEKKLEEGWWNPDGE